MTLSARQTDRLQETNRPGVGQLGSTCLTALAGPAATAAAPSRLLVALAAVLALALPLAVGPEVARLALCTGTRQRRKARE